MFTVFFPIKTLESFSSCRDHIRNYIKDSVLFLGSPDTKNQWTTFIEEYMLALGKNVKYLFIKFYNFKSIISVVFGTEVQPLTNYLTIYARPFIHFSANEHSAHINLKREHCTSGCLLICWMCENVWFGTWENLRCQS